MAIRQSKYPTRKRNEKQIYIFFKEKKKDKNNNIILSFGKY